MGLLSDPPTSASAHGRAVPEFLRWTTLHPALVSLSLGLLPFAALSYLLAYRRRSERWTNVADLAALVGAAGAALGAVSGLIAHFSLKWPGGLAPWPALHLSTGLLTALCAIAFAALRSVRRKRQLVATRGWAMGAVAVALLGAGTGWVGGTVLVFHAGAAVKAAGYGSLAPPWGRREEPPENLRQAMGWLRGDWASAIAQVSQMVVDQATEPGFRDLAASAQRIQEVSLWLTRQGASSLELEQLEAEELFQEVSGHLLSHARNLEDAALHQDFQGVVHALSDLTAACANCHEQLRSVEGKERVPRRPPGRPRARGAAWTPGRPIGGPPGS